MWSILKNSRTLVKPLSSNIVGAERDLSPYSVAYGSSFQGRHANSKIETTKTNNLENIIQ